VYAGLRSDAHPDSIRQPVALVLVILPLPEGTLDRQRRVVGYPVVVREIWVSVDDRDVLRALLTH
jgi:hypothetical protein